MSQLIPKSFIDDLLSRIDLVELIGVRVKLKQNGSNFVGLCPFHSEKTPSFTVSQTKQFYHCFGCNVSGNALGFLMQFERLDFVEAVENLAASVGLAVPKTDKLGGNSYHTDLYEINERVTQFFEGELRKSKVAIAYLKTRGFSGEICKKFRIGYAPDSWDNLAKFYGNSVDTRQRMISLGLIGTNNKQHTYAKLRNRIIFPIRNTKGNVIGFGGRTIANDLAKYLNSPESTIFHKGSELYGLYEARKCSGTIEHLIVVEGYLDVVSLAQFGITNVVATLGTAISSRQVQLLLRYASTVTFCFDGDIAGRAAAWRALENSLPFLRDGINMNFLFLPEGIDPDSLIRRESREHFDLLLKTATISLEDFFISQLLHRVNIDTIEGKSKLIKIAQGLLEQMPRGIFYGLLLSKIAAITQVNVEEIASTIVAAASETKSGVQLEKKLALPPQIQKIISILLHFPSLILEVIELDRLKSMRIGGIELLWKLYDLIKSHPTITTGAILEHWRGSDEEEIFHELAQKVPILPEEVLKSELLGLIRTLDRVADETEVNRLLETANKGNMDADKRKQLRDLIITLKQ